MRSLTCVRDDKTQFCYRQVLQPKVARSVGGEQQNAPTTAQRKVLHGKQVNGYNWLLSACFSVLFVGGSINLLILFCTFFEKSTQKTG